MAAVLCLIGSSAAPAAADPVRDRQWYLSALKVSEVHKTTRGAGVTIALIDSGVDAKHRDLAAAVVRGKDFVNGKGDGRTDLNGHGTAMAGIIAGRGHGEGSGILGIAPAAKILPLSTTSDFFANSDEVRNALDFAADHGARVINMSFGSGDDVTLHDAIRAAQARDIVLVASSGNKGDADEGYPGKYPEVLTVGAVGRDGGIADLSVTGPQVDLTAPGVDIATTSIYKQGYSSGSGTSQATAIVSGAAALVRAKYPDLSAAEVVHRLTATATDAGKPGRDDTYGYGRLDLLKALTADVPAAAPAVSAGASDDGASLRASDSGPGPRRVSPLLVGGLAIAGVLLIGGLVVGLLVVVRRRRS
ncbi:type VII secretion-associated serine protease mycosin [Couchioplanes caeruleus]|uniref:type VII secretion-associated serine protease mycosin n=1 Tax=Couchioplanes caeruleus TaxID=56438 RepID=UPI00201BFD71|nr:type VII secretion-associated serine protease mycosin [Couchioplanes caeruleus]UQU63434.1 type VII secretion-associated serine protease mycosin [Couchioplanes caeruleus]